MSDEKKIITMLPEFSIKFTGIDVVSIIATGKDKEMYELFYNFWLRFPIDQRKTLANIMIQSLANVGSDFVDQNKA